MGVRVSPPANTPHVQNSRVVTIFLTAVDKLALHYERAASLVSEDRRKLAGAFCNKNDALRSLAAGLLLRRIAGEKPVLRSANGKPWTKEGCHFSLSHSGNYAVAAAADCPVGIDIECVHRKRRPDFDLLVRRAFHPSEAALYRKRPSPECFYKIWTQKESFVKIRGGVSMKSFSVTDAIGQGAYWKVFDNIPDYTIALCSSAQFDEVLFDYVSLEGV